jgi:diguanylate cyclase (GGDEF)-like protein
MRERAFRVLQVGTVAAAGLLFLALAPGIPFARWTEILFFVLLATLAFRLRVRYAGNYVGLEAAALVPAILLLESPGAVMLICLAADILAKTLARQRRLSLPTGFDVAQLALSYGLAAAFFRSVHRPSTELSALAVETAGVLVVFFFINTLLVFGYLELGRLVARERLIEMGLFQLLALLLLTPIVGLQILMHRHYGIPGLLLAFFPVVLASFVVRNLSSIEQKYNEVARENRELEAMREISNVFALGARSDRYERVFQAITRVVPAEAAAFVEWAGDAPGDFAVHLAGATASGRRRVEDWVRENRLDESGADAPGEAVERRLGEERKVRLSPILPYQVLSRLSTYEMSTGLLVMESSFPALHSASVLATIRALSDHLALVLQDRSIRGQIQELSERNRERAETLDQILQISNELKQHLTLDTLFHSIVSGVARSLGFHVVLLALHDAERNVFERRAQFGLDRRWAELKGQVVPALEITKFWVEEHRISKSYFVRRKSREELGPYDVVTAPAARRMAPNGWRPYDVLHIPLMAGERLVGCLSVDDPNSGLAPSVETVRALEIFANQAVAAIENARSYTDAREQSIRDGLTGAYNHRHFQESLQKELGRAERIGRPLSVLMLDIDDFKGINDRHGHPVGDAILSRIVGEIRSEVRGDMDLVARYGGEEFAVLLPETPPDDAREVAERVRRRIDERMFRPPDSEDIIRVTVSIGLATFPEDAQSKKELIEKADAALYRAKRGGKNAVKGQLIDDSDASGVTH